MEYYDAVNNASIKNVQRIPTGTYGVACVDVGVGLEVLEHLLQVAPAGRAEEAGVVVRLKKINETYIFDLVHIR
jgi:hypothetical protein